MLSCRPRKLQQKGSRQKKNTIRAFVNTEIYLKNVSITAKFSSGKGWNKSALQPGFKRFLWAFVLWNLNLIVI